MKVESTALTEQRETCDDEKEKSNADLEFSSWFSVVVLICLSAWSCSVRKAPFGAHPQNGARKLSSLYIFVASVKLHVFISITSRS